MNSSPLSLSLRCSEMRIEAEGVSFRFSEQFGMVASLELALGSPREAELSAQGPRVERMIEIQLVSLSARANSQPGIILPPSSVGLGLV